MAHVVVAGSYGAGMTVVTDTTPGPGESVIGREFRIDPGGKGSNQAVAAVRLGARAHLVTALGTDPFADDARRLWAAEGVTADAATYPQAGTMKAVIVVESDGENRIVVVPGALAELTAADADRHAATIRAADVCLTQHEVAPEFTRQALRIARAAGVTTLFNPAPAPDTTADPDVLTEILSLSDYLTPNAHEARRLAGLPGADPESAARALAERTGRRVVMTTGPHGALLAHAGAVRRVPGEPVAEPVDTTGAGDAFNGALAVALTDGADDLDAVRFACRAGAHAVRFPGVIPGLPYRKDLR